MCLPSNRTAERLLPRGRCRVSGHGGLREVVERDEARGELRTIREQGPECSALLLYFFKMLILFSIGTKSIVLERIFEF